MDFTIASILVVDGITNGAIYALLGLAIVLVFAVTRIIFVPQGEFVAYGALTLALLQTGQVPGTVWLLLCLAAVAAAMELFTTWRQGRGVAAAFKSALRLVALPVSLAFITAWAAPHQFPMGVQAVLTVGLVASFGPLIYRVAFQSLADASTLVLLIVSVGVHFAMTGLALLFFGAEGFRNPSFWDARLALGGLTINGQAIIIAAATIALMVLLWLFFERSVYGKALRATAINRVGARLMGISSHAAGQMTLAMAGLIGALSGLLIGPTTTIFYDSGFLIGLKGFVAAVIGGLASYPAAAVGALFVGIVEAFASFWVSAFKEVVVFTLIIPVLLWRSITSPHSDEDH
ncbi:branched-chain amino acid ABC transporter permease [Ramlibacter sp. AW1]|uniref:Branched-chain amino acid ABC transporter permease n=1 Tax=Ramlibacter aurantiacus TaxID=2801330 RepID=A0A936ZXM3_9BURK|nr:branched-chain amino acid ABC transporter permease [Ramlibacter aurantiacus]MBL0422369.1 branched-chain amino acid ABC transporter permease [Ramlibacter aurantiacus]